MTVLGAAKFSTTEFSALSLKAGSSKTLFVSRKKMKKILIAEDNAVNRELLRELLLARGYVVEEACDGQEALQKIAESVPDALLLDLSMPVMDGWTTVRKIREDPGTMCLHVLAVTAYAMRGDREKALEAGFDGYLAKPIDFALLDAELGRLWEKRERATSE